jgi:5-methylcytosine-specific restriction protein B
VTKAATLKILFGPPGTGKTYRAAREAVRIATGKPPPEGDALTSIFRSLMDARRVWWVTFHPSYSYEDFIEGIRPKLTDDKQVIYEVVDGPFKLACEACAAHRRTDIVAGEVIKTTKEFVVTRADDNAITVRSDVTRKDAVAGSKEETVAIDVLERLRAAAIKPEELSHSGQEHDKRKDVAQRAGLTVMALTTTGPLRAVYTRYLQSAEHKAPAPVVLVIDEINRADLSRVFGELITLLELDKREGASEERRVFLPYSRKLFVIPAGLSVIGTMNTADRSLALMDFALRRRFDFEEVEPDPALCPANYGGVNVAALLASWNARIAVLRSRDHRIGHAEFMESKLEEVRKETGWAGNPDGRLRALAHTIRRKIIPLLLEYFHEDWRKARLVLGNASLDLMAEVQPSDPEEYFGDNDIGDSKSFDIRQWWDPTSPNWDPDSLRAKLKAALPTS